ncbi:MAG: glycosyltransferase family 2 protein [Trueperaceae bacterium]|nr:glycosyltransferase family 2 protein [Trueperaceae bacterium]
MLIPAFNEEATLAQIVKVALAAELGPVLVVDDGSEDSSAKVAQTAGAAVLKLEQNLGKGGAVYLGAEALKTPVIVLIDADLIGLSPKHISDLANPVLSGEVNMTRGVFSGGRLATTLAQNLAPYLNGQRGIEREKLLSVPAIQESRYGIEVLITQAARTQKWRCQDIELKNVSQIMKEEKRGFWQGFKHRLQGYAEILKSLLKPKAHNKQSHN